MHYCELSWRLIQSIFNFSSFQTRIIPSICLHQLVPKMLIDISINYLWIGLKCSKQFRIQKNLVSSLLICLLYNIGANCKKTEKNQLHLSLFLTFIQWNNIEVVKIVFNFVFIVEIYLIQIFQVFLFSILF